MAVYPLGFAKGPITATKVASILLSDEDSLWEWLTLLTS
jgi:hypothetical protein